LHLLDIAVTYGGVSGTSRQTKMFCVYRHPCILFIQGRSTVVAINFSITEREEVFMRVIDPLLGIKEMMRITGLSRVSVYRKVSAARAGQSRFPIPVSERKERLRWCATDIEAYCQARGGTQDCLEPKQEGGLN
jgi:predicted DNA-binding transcriptional regulator AlpA